MVKRKYVLKLNFIPHLYSESEIEISQKEYVDIKLGRLKHSDIEKKYFNKKDRGFKEIMNNRNDKLEGLDLYHFGIYSINVTTK